MPLEAWKVLCLTIGTHVSPPNFLHYYGIQACRSHSYCIFIPQSNTVDRAMISLHALLAGMSCDNQSVHLTLAEFFLPESS